MKPLLITAILLLLSATTGNEKTEEYVYICQGSRSECYHKTKDCVGLSYCTTDIKKVTVSEAKQLKRRKCTFCYGNNK